MNTLEDIRFDGNTFLPFPKRILTLYQTNQERVALFIPIKHPDCLTFNQHFNEIIPCQDQIGTNPQTTMFLFIYSENLDTWLWNHNLVPDNLEHIRIFAPFWEDAQYFLDWTKRYTQKCTDVFIYSELEKELFIFGLIFLEELCSNIQGNEPIIDQLRQQQETIRINLINALQ